MIDVNTLKEIMDAVSKVSESNLCEPVVQRLYSFGYTATPDDAFLIGYAVKSVETEFAFECNIDSIPEQFENVAVDMAVGEILRTKHNSGKLDIDSLDLDGAVASISMGDSSVSFKGTSDVEKLEGLINILTTRRQGVYSCIRKIRW